MKYSKIVDRLLNILTVICMIPKVNLGLEKLDLCFNLYVSLK